MFMMQPPLNGVIQGGCHGMDVIFVRY